MSIPDLRYSKRTIPLLLALACAPAMAFEAPPCWTTPVQLLANGGSPGYPRMWSSPSGSGGALMAACQDASGWHGYEMHWTASWLSGPSGTYEQVHVLNRYTTANARFWSIYSSSLSCAQIVATPSTDAQLNKLCGEVNTALTAWVSGLPK